MGEHVLIPLDGSDDADEAFEYAMEHLPGSTITLVHVVDPTDVWMYGSEDYFDVEGYQREERRRRERAEELMDEYADRASERGVDVETVIATGVAAKKILETAETENADHIVMGSRGRSGVGRILFGSVAEEVTRRASVPVTIVR